MNRITLTIDERICCGCHACEVACKQEHGLGVGPRVVRVLERTPVFKPLYCHHCTDAPCAIACPEEAILTEVGTGIVLHDNGKCDGCDAVEGKSGAEKQDTSPCKVACPAHINVQGYVNLAAKGKFREALELIKLSSPFPSICGRVCPHPCEPACNRGDIDAAVATHAIERYLGDLDLKARKRYLPRIKGRRAEKVAIVGSGPAGLSCAYYLAQEGYQVTIFEKASVPGGMLAMGIPAYRLPREIVEAEVQLIRDLGVTIETGVEIGIDQTVGELREAGFRAFFIAVGTQECLQLGIDGEDLAGVHSGLDYLRQVNLGEAVRLGRVVAVIGGGNTALDAARTARRLGAEEATILYRRGLEEMPSRLEEIEECQAEGVPIHTLAQPVRFLGDNGRVRAIECIRTRLAEVDESGRRRPEAVAGSEFTVAVDAVINALGQESDWACLTHECACTLTDWGTMNVDAVTLQSEDPDIFAGGDAVRGPGTVVEAIADGREAAESIDRYLRGLDLRLGRGAGLTSITAPAVGAYDPAARVPMPRLASQERATSFAEVDLGYTEGMVIQEAQRCISCGACCVQACPYDVMQFNHEITKAVKCDLCVEKRGREEAPACTVVCPTRCIFWGDPETFPIGIEVAELL
jgi:NADPH-dependent glutamate synthase beta subunit-like oxidoreductase